MRWYNKMPSFENFYTLLCRLWQWCITLNNVFFFKVIVSCRCLQHNYMQKVDRIKYIPFLNASFCCTGTTFALECMCYSLHAYSLLTQFLLNIMSYSISTPRLKRFHCSDLGIYDLVRCLFLFPSGVFTNGQSHWAVIIKHKRFCFVTSNLKIFFKSES